MTILRRHADGQSLDHPVPTITAGGTHIGLAEPFLVEYYGDSHVGQKRVRSVKEPLPTQSTENRFGLCEPFIIPMEHSGRQPVRSTDHPLPTITTAKAGSFGLCEPFLTKYYGAGEGVKPVTDPLDTVTVRDRFALCEPIQERNGLDIRFRMLQPHELAAAMGFEGYEFKGTKTDIVKQIGNAVPVHLSEALCRRLLTS